MLSHQYLEMGCGVWYPSYPYYFLSWLDERLYICLLYLQMVNAKRNFKGREYPSDCFTTIKIKKSPNCVAPQFGDVIFYLYELVISFCLLAFGNMYF